MMKLLVPLLLLAFLASPVVAALGDTEAELAQRYGKQVKTGTSAIPGVTIRGFVYKGFLIVVGVLNGRSAFEMYARNDHAKLSAGEVAAFLNVNAGGHVWNTDAGGTAELAKWVLDDGSVFAEWDKSAAGSQLTVKTRAAADLEAHTPPKK